MVGVDSVDEVETSGDLRLGWAIAKKHQMCEAAIDHHLLHINTFLDVQDECLVMLLWLDVHESFVNGGVVAASVLGHDEVGLDLVVLSVEELTSVEINPIGKLIFMAEDGEIISEKAATSGGSGNSKATDGLNNRGNTGDESKAVAGHFHAGGHNLSHSVTGISLNPFEPVEACLLVGDGTAEPNLQVGENVIDVGEVEILEFGEGSLQVVDGAVGKLLTGVEGGLAAGVLLEVLEDGGVLGRLPYLDNGDLESALDELLGVAGVVAGGVEAVNTGLLVVGVLTEGLDGFLGGGEVFAAVVFGVVVPHVVGEEGNHHGNEKQGAHGGYSYLFLRIVRHFSIFLGVFLCFFCFFFWFFFGGSSSRNDQMLI